jgi:hypothetical protein
VAPGEIHALASLGVPSSRHPMHTTLKSSLVASSAQPPSALSGAPERAGMARPDPYCGRGGAADLSGLRTRLIGRVRGRVPVAGREAPRGCRR